MERENKFRVWDNEKNEYFKPIYEAYKGNLEEMLLSQSGELIMRTMIQSIHCPSVYPNRFETEFFTGLQDKNGKDIYEGDIVKWEWTGINIEPIVYTDMGFNPKGWAHSNQFKYEIIGNIHENKL